MEKIRRLAAILFMLMLCVAVRVPSTAQDDQQTEEQQLGDQTYQDLKSQGVLVQSSPLYDVLRPIEREITRVIQPQYPYPIHFYIVHNSEPNAFAAPGGNVYVIDSLMYFVHNREELAGTLCHETSHLLHHDSMRQMSHDDAILRRQIIAAILLGGGLGTVIATQAVGELDSLHYSRQAEESADLTGADNCAKAGLNPWGLVWLFQDFNAANMKTPPEILSDHPDNANRIAALEAHFQANPALFGRYDSNPKLATKMKLPKNVSETFVR